MQIVIFDDYKHDSFYPITLLRPVSDIRTGILKLRQRIEHSFNAEQTNLLVCGSLVDLYKERHPDWTLNDVPSGDKLYINSRLKINDELTHLISTLKNGERLVSAGETIALRTTDSLSFGFSADAYKVIEYTKEALYQQMAEIIHDNARLIRWDFEHIFYDEDNFFETEPGVYVLDPYSIWISEGVKLAPNVVLDATEGPIVIDEGAVVMPNAVIQGPAYIGKKTLIKIGAKIYGGTSIGPVCKVGGEVENSIFQAYSNKQHDGFLGHSFIGEWVNLGADTNNSDLKNTYKNVKCYNYHHKAFIDSKTQFMGAVIGDHTKTGINTSLNTGLVAGIACNLYGSTLFSSHIPSFSWGEASTLDRYHFEAFLETAIRVKDRRNQKISPAEISLLKQIYGE